jgi:cytochrome c
MKLIVTGMALLLAATGLAQAAGDPVAGQALFMQPGKCMLCHKVGPGAVNGIGPVLNGVVGRMAGTYAGYMYSDANKNSGIVWTEAVLTKYLAGPAVLVPGTKMTFPGFTGPTADADIANIIAYLKTFKADGTPAQ